LARNREGRSMTEKPRYPELIPAPQVNADLVALAMLGEPKPDTGKRDNVVSIAPQDDPGFSWDDTESVVFHKQPRTAVYWNPWGQIVIRQEDDYGDDDPWVYFDPDRLPALIAALQREYDSWRRDQERGGFRPAS
jgi:hypothetical protein